MGQDKAQMPFLGKPIIQRVVERVVGLADELLVTTNQPENLQFLGLPLIEDILPGRGALGGMYTALQAASHDSVIILACDMPFVNARLLSYQNNLLDNLAVDGVVPRTSDGLEPFHAVYRRSTCLPAVQTALEDGKWRADAWFERVRLRYLEMAEILLYDAQLLSLCNLNTLEEYQQALELAQSIDILVKK